MTSLRLSSGRTESNSTMFLIFSSILCTLSFFSYSFPLKKSYGGAALYSISGKNELFANVLALTGRKLGDKIKKIEMAVLLWILLR